MMKKVCLAMLLGLLSFLSWAGIPGDFDGSGVVDVNDLVILSQQWLGPPSAMSADIAPEPNDGFVDFLDFAEFSKHWLATLPDSNEMILIPGGHFQMGDSLGDSYDTDPNKSDELPVHPVTLDPFYIGKYEITNGQFCTFLNAALDSNSIYVDGSLVKRREDNITYCNIAGFDPPCQILYLDGVFSVLDKDGRDMTNDPIASVTWYGAAAYCNWRSERSGYQRCYDLSTWECNFTRKGYRLPTEAEWEYAARGGFEGGRFPWYDPNTISHEFANYKSSPGFPEYDVSETAGCHPDWSTGDKPYTSPGGSFAPNGYGLYDVAGNVNEWCNDWYGNNYYSESPSDNPPGPEFSTAKVIRGGYWNRSADFCRVADRSSWFPNSPREGNGFRICLDLE